MSRLDDFVVFDTLRVSNLKLSPKRIQATYTTIRSDGLTASKDLIYSYESPCFQPGKAADQNLASLMAVQVALNYGLFCRELVLEGNFEPTDRAFLEGMLENTSREILTNKLLIDNPFIKPDYKNLEVDKAERYTRATLLFKSPDQEEKPETTRYPRPDFGQFAILSSGGKDSLLTYGLVQELGQAHPVFINESGRHWFTAVNAYRYFEKTEPNTAKPWCNSDRIFNWMLKQMPFIREDYAQIRADIYPIRLWTVAVFLFGVLPIALMRGAGNILIGNEYDTTVRGRTKGIWHYCGLYDQSRFFDNACTEYYRKKGWRLRQYSLLRSLSELLIMKVLIGRYPKLQAHQISCHAAHQQDGRMRPCGKCEKCRRIIGMMIALDANPEHCGYSPEQIARGLAQLATHSVKQLGSDAAHLYHLLVEKKKLPLNSHTRMAARPHPEILNLRFDRERSRLEDLPNPVRQPLLELLLPYADKCVQKQAAAWKPYEPKTIQLQTLKYAPYAL